MQYILLLMKTTTNMKTKHTKVERIAAALHAAGIKVLSTAEPSLIEDGSIDLERQMSVQVGDGPLMIVETLPGGKMRFARTTIGNLVCDVEMAMAMSPHRPDRT